MIHPETNKVISVFGDEAKNILKKYLLTIKNHQQQQQQ